MTERAQMRTALAIVVLALAVVLGGQAAADRIAPRVPDGALTGRTLGRTGFAYLTGLRQFGAAFLWNRLDPQMHEYYDEADISTMTFMLPSMKAVLTLDPQFVDGYYVAPVILIESGARSAASPAIVASRLKTALDLAKEGVDNNPKSGLLLTSYAELLLTRAKDATAALPFAERAMASDAVWRTDEEQWDSCAILRVVFTTNGLPARAAEAQAIMDAIDADPNATMNAVDDDE